MAQALKEFTVSIRASIEGMEVLKKAMNPEVLVRSGTWYPLAGLYPLNFAGRAVDQLDTNGVFAPNAYGVTVYQPGFGFVEPPLVNAVGQALRRTGSWFRFRRTRSD